jgi:hypothetical protein
LTPSPVTATISPRRLRAFDDAHLLLGSDAGEEDLRGCRGQLQLRLGQAAQGSPLNDRRVPLDEADLAGDREAGVRVVAGDHDDPDARRAAAGDGLRHLGPGRVVEADQPGGKGENAQTPTRHLVLRRQQAGAGGWIEWRDAGVELDEAAAGEHRLESALAVEHAALRRLADHRHALAVGVERNLVNALAAGKIAGEIAADLGQCDLHRIATQAVPALLIDLLQVVAKRGIDEQRTVIVYHMRPLRQIGAWHERAADPQLLHRHPVLRQRAGLVAADHGRRAERLDRRQVAYQCVAPGHSLGGHGQRQGDGRQQSLGDVGDDDADGEQQILPRRQPDGLTDEEQQQPYASGQAGDDPRQAGDLALQRRAALAGGLRQVGDAAELGAHAGSVDHGARLSGNDRGASEDDVRRLQRRLLVARLERACLGERFAGHRRQVDAQPGDFGQAAVGRHEIAFFEQHDVARYQFAGEQAGDFAGAQRLHLLRQQLAQRCHRTLRPVLLPEREDAVDDDDADDGQPQLRHPLPRVEVLGNERQTGADPEDDGEEMGEFLCEAQQQVLLLDFFEQVGPELAEPAHRLARFQPGE